MPKLEEYLSTTDALIKTLDRNLSILKDLYGRVNDEAMQRKIVHSMYLHWGMRYYCVSLQELLQNQAFLKFNAQFLKLEEMAKDISPELLPETQRLTLSPSNPSIGDCADKLLSICHYGAYIKMLSEQTCRDMSQLRLRMISYAQLAEKIVVYVMCGVALIAAFLAPYAATVPVIAAFLLYGAIPITLVSCAIACAAVEVQNRYGNQFINDSQQLKRMNRAFFTPDLDSECRTRKRAECAKDFPDNLSTLETEIQTITSVDSALSSLSNMQQAFFNYPHPMNEPFTMVGTTQYRK